MNKEVAKFISWVLLYLFAAGWALADANVRWPADDPECVHRVCQSDRQIGRAIYAVFWPVMVPVFISFDFAKAK